MITGMNHADLQKFLDTTPNHLHPVDTHAEFMMDVHMAGEGGLEEGAHYYQAGRTFGLMLVGKCGNLLESGLCRLEEQGIVKPEPCRAFEAGGKGCQKRRDMHGVSNIVSIDSIG